MKNNDNILNKLVKKCRASQKIARPKVVTEALNLPMIRVCPAIAATFAGVMGGSSHVA